MNLKMYYNDMGYFTQPGVKSREDALWHVNDARRRDGLTEFTAEEFERLFNGTDCGFAEIVDEP